MKKYVKNTLYFMGVFAFLFLLWNVDTISQAKVDPVQEAKKSVIEIYAGVNDTEGDFHEIKHASGVIISSQDNLSYILTSYKFKNISQKKIQKYCKKYGIAIDEYASESVILKAVVKGDVIVDATLVTESEDKNFSIFQIDNSMSEKIPLAIGDSDELVIGSQVYALGFPKDAGKDDEATNRNTQFTEEDVVISQGNITDTMSNQGGISYLQHTANVDKGNQGGPLVDEDGYIVGINDASLSSEDENYSIPINDIAEILDNFKLEYESKAKRLSLASLADQVAECKKMIDSGKYKSNSTETLETAIEEAESLQKEGTENLDSVAQVMEDMETGKSQLVLKMKTSRKIVIVFAIIDACALLLLVKTLLDKNKLGNASNSPKKKEKASSTQKPLKTSASEEKAAVEEKAPLKMENLPEASANELKKNLDQKDEILPDNATDSTVILSALDSGKNARPKAKITILRTGDQFEITKLSFNIGKNPDITDYTILGNPAVSRLHATIIWGNSGYSISDRGSANGTYVNGNTVGKNQRYPLKNGDSIILANEECVFEILE